DRQQVETGEFEKCRRCLGSTGCLKRAFLAVTFTVDVLDVRTTHVDVIVIQHAVSQRQSQARAQVPRQRQQRGETTGHHAAASSCLRANPSDGGPSTGSRNQKVLPLPKIDSTPIWPPCISTNRLHSANPRPVPCAARVVDESTCENSWNSLGMSSVRMPTPLSDTEIHTTSRGISLAKSPWRGCSRSGIGAAVRTTEIEILPPSPVNFDALESRLISTWRTRALSARISRSTLSGRSTRHSWCLAVRSDAVSVTAAVTASRTSQRSSDSTIRPASILERSSTELMRPSR